MTLLQLFALLAAVFSLALLALPTVRVLQGRLQARSVAGLWTSGVGFGLLAMAGLALEGDEAQTAVVLGVSGAVVGWFLQRSAIAAAQEEREEGAGPSAPNGGSASGSGSPGRVPEAPPRLPA